MLLLQELSLSCLLDFGKVVKHACVDSLQARGVLGTFNLGREVHLTHHQSSKKLELPNLYDLRDKLSGHISNLPRKLLILSSRLRGEILEVLTDLLIKLGQHLSKLLVMLSSFHPKLV